MQIRTVNSSQNVKNNQLQNPVSFKGISWYLIIKVFEKGVGAIKNAQKGLYIHELANKLPIISRDASLMELDYDKCRIFYAAIAKTPDSFFSESNAYSFSGGLCAYGNPFYPVYTMADVRKHALTLLPKIKDKNQYLIQSKKDFLHSILDNGYEIPLQFYHVFKNLDDVHYARFKANIIDECLYSTKYAQSRKPRSPMDTNVANYLASSLYSNEREMTELWGPNRIIERMFNNLVLISTLNPVVFGKYIESNRSIINKQKAIVLDAINKARPEISGGLKNFYMLKIKHL